jgi:hypothetical protein
VGEIAAHHTGVSLDRDGLQAAAGEERRVGALHPVIAHDRALVIRVEAVGVLHDELAGAHQAVARSDLVPELGADLIEILGQVAVAGDLGLHERRDDLLVGRPEDVFRLLRAALAGTGVVDPIHDLARRRPARAINPVLDGMNERHGQLDGTLAVHFLAAELADLLHNAQAGRHVGVEAAAQFAHEARAQEQLVRRYLGVGGAFLQCRDECLRPIFHVNPDENNSAGTAQLYLRGARECGDLSPLSKRPREAALPNRLEVWQRLL